ncbi:MAG TPA: PRTRC system protein E [Candidatus Sulfotelmatobacter sp.]
MFKELAPVLRHRAVLMTITSTEDDQIRVNVVPKKLKDDENKALTTPLTVTGAAEELDAELGQTLVDFVGSHLQLKNTLVQAKADMDAAAKAAQAEARAKTKTPATERNERYHCLEAVGAAGQACGTGPAASSEDRESVRHAGGASAGSGRPAGDGRRGRYPRRDQG